MTAQNPFSVDDAAPATYDEFSRQRFISAMRRKVLVDLATDMRKTYDAQVAPKIEREGDNSPRGAVEVRRAMEDKDIYKFYSTSRYKLQEMTWESVRPQVERNMGTLMEMANTVENKVGGSLRLNPDLEIPRYVSELDVHLMPGSFHSEYQDNDVAQAAIYSNGIGVFYGGLPLTHGGSGPGASIAHYLKVAYPDFDPRAIVDLGCTTGNNTIAYCDVYPDADVYGVDVGAPLLRYGHARAEAIGRKIHFVQQNAETLDFADESVDLITSSYLLHELPVKSTLEVFKECFRILKPGGLMIHFELPPSSEVDPYLDFYLDWDAYYNNEPSYAQFRGQSLRALCEKAGFSADTYMQQRIYNWGTVPEDQFNAAARGEIKAEVILNGGSWFTFGAWK